MPCSLLALIIEFTLTRGPYLFFTQVVLMLLLMSGGRSIRILKPQVEYMVADIDVGKDFSTCLSTKKIQKYVLLNKFPDSALR